MSPSTFRKTYEAYWLGPAGLFFCSYSRESCALSRRPAQFRMEAQGCPSNHWQHVSGQQKGARGFPILCWELHSICTQAYKLSEPGYSPSTVRSSDHHFGCHQSYRLISLSNVGFPQKRSGTIRGRMKSCPLEKSPFCSQIHWSVEYPIFRQVLIHSLWKILKENHCLYSGMKKPTKVHNFLPFVSPAPKAYEIYSLSKRIFQR